MNISLGNATDNLINIDSTGGITISGIIKNITGKSNHITLGGTGGGALTLSGVNTFTGGVTITANTLLDINNAAALGAGTFTINGGTIDNTSTAAIGPFTNNNAQTWNGDFTFTGGAGTTHNLDFGTGAVSLGTTAGTTRTVTVTAGTLTIGGIISDGTTVNSLIVAGTTGTLALTGANAYTGGTTINAGGTLSIGNGSTTGALSTTGAIADNGTLIINRSNDVAQATDFTGAAITGSGTLNKLGAGKLTLTAANSYGGLTTVSAGTLVLAGGSSIASATVSSASTFLTGTGTVTGNLAIGGGGQVAPGTSTVPGTLNVGTVSLNGAGSYLWKLTDATGAAGTGWDQIVVGSGAGAVTIGATSGSQFTVALTSLAATPANWNNANSASYAIIHAGSLATFDVSKFSINTTAFTAPSGGGIWSLAQSGGDLLLNFTPGGGTITINVPGGTQTQTAAGYATLTGSNDVIKTGAGELTLTNPANNYTGSTTIQAGTATATVDAPNNAAGALGNSATAVVLGDTTGSAPATLNIDTVGVTVGRGVAVQAGSSGTKTISGTNTTGTVTYSGNISLADNVTLSAALGGTVAFGGVISGNGFGVTKIGSGTVNFSGPNSYSGPTTITTGTLATTVADAIPDASAVSVAGGAFFILGGSETVGSISGAGTIALGANALTAGGDNTVTNTFSGTFTGDSGSLIKTGSGQLILSGDNSGWAGAITLSAGTLSIGVNGLSTGALALNGGTFASADGADRTIGNAVTVGGSVILGAASTGNLVFSNTVGLGAATRSLTANSSVKFNGAVSNGGISKSGTGLLEFANASNPLTALTITGGSAQIDSGAQVTLTNGALNTSNSTTLTISGTLLNNSTTGFPSQAGTVTVASGGTVIQQGIGSPSAFLFTGTVPAVFQAGSTLIFRDYVNTSPSVSGRTYGGNLTFDSSGGAVAVGAITGGNAWTVNGDFTIGANTSFNYGTHSGGTTFNGNVTVNGTLGGTNAAESFTIGNGKTLSVGSSGILNVATGKVVTIASGGNGTITGTLGGAGGLTSAGTTAITGTATASYTGPTSVTGGALTVSAAISGTASVSLTGGSLILGASNVVADAAPVTFGGGTLNTGGFSEFTGTGDGVGSNGTAAGLGQLILTDNSTIDFSNGAQSILWFNSVGALTGGKTLAVTNWMGSVAGGGNDQLRFTSDPSALIGQITFNGASASEVFFSNAGGLSYYELVPVPEPSSTALVGSAALLGLITFRERRRKCMAARARKTQSPTVG